MRKIFTYLGLALIPFGAGAQDIEIYLPGETDDISGTTIELDSEEGTLHQEFDVKNVGDATLDLRITRVKITELAGTEDYLCWGTDAITGACYPADVVAPVNPWTTPESTALMPDSLGWLSVYHETNDISGCAQYRYYIIDETDARLDSVDVLSCSTVSIEEDVKVEVTVYPNPVSELLNVRLENDMNNVNFTLYNVLGDVVMSSKLNSGVNTLSVSSLPNGVYFYSILKKGNVVETKKLVIRH